MKHWMDFDNVDAPGWASIESLESMVCVLNSYIPSTYSRHGTRYHLLNRYPNGQVFFHLLNRPVVEVDITPTKGGFLVARKPCPTCGEPPFGDEYSCGCGKEAR